MSKFPSKLITIEAISDKEEKRTAAIKGTDGNWYNIWKDYEDEPTIEYSQLKQGNHGEPFKKGDQAIISFKEGEYNGKPQFTIKSIFTTDGGVRAPEQPKAQNSVPRASQSVTEGSRDFKEEAVGKCQTLFLQAYIQAGNSIQDAKLQVVPARKLAELVVYGTQQELPTITQEDDPAGEFNPMVNDEVDVENIPF